MRFGWLVGKASPACHTWMAKRAIQRKGWGIGVPTKCEKGENVIFPSSRKTLLSVLSAQPPRRTHPPGESNLQSNARDGVEEAGREEGVFPFPPSPMGWMRSQVRDILARQRRRRGICNLMGFLFFPPCRRGLLAWTKGKSREGGRRIGHAHTHTLAVFACMNCARKSSVADADVTCRWSQILPCQRARTLNAPRRMEKHAHAIG